MNVIAERLSGVPLVPRWAIIGATTASVIGAIVGLIIGLCVYAPTAPFAVVELGLPAAIVGGVLGLTAGVIGAASRWIKRNGARSHSTQSPAGRRHRPHK